MMVKFCSNCGAANTPDARNCAKCGNAMAPILSTVQEARIVADAPEPAENGQVRNHADTSSVHSRTADEPEPSNWLFIGAIAGIVLLIGALYFFIFVYDDIQPSQSADTRTAPSSAGLAMVQLYTVTTANIRDRPTTAGSNIIGKLPRGSALSGVLKVSDDGSEWLELSEGKGFVAAINLIDTEPPKIVQSLGDRAWIADARVDIFGPAPVNELIDSAAAGTKLTLSGLTDTGLIEVKLADGRLGYIRDGKAVLARLGGKPIVIVFNPQTCNFGGELGAEFAKIGARLRAQWQELESREYADEESRNRAYAAAEGKSTFVKLPRSFEGLSLTNIAQHYESQSVYFADPPTKVIEVFRTKGFRIDDNGNFPSSDFFAAIAGTRGEGTAYGKSELGCGV